MTKAQLALAGAKLKEWFAARAADRRKATQNNRAAKAVVTNSSPQEERGKARDLAAKAVGRQRHRR